MTRLARMAAMFLAVFIAAVFSAGNKAAIAAPAGSQTVSVAHAAAPSGGPITTQSAIGTSPIGTFQYSAGGVTIKVPTGCFFTHYINGDGQTINYDRVGTDCAGPGYLFGGFCNYAFQMHYYNLSGAEYASPRKSPVFSKCSYNTLYTFTTNTRYLIGKACAWLMVGGVHRATQCHNILAG